MKLKRRKVAKKETFSVYSHRRYGLYHIVLMRPDGKKLKQNALWSRNGWFDEDGETKLKYFIYKVDEKILKVKD